MIKLRGWFGSCIRGVIGASVLSVILLSLIVMPYAEDLISGGASEDSTSETSASSESTAASAADEVTGATEAQTSSTAADETAATDTTVPTTAENTDAVTAVTDATDASTTDSTDAETAVTDATDASTTDSTNADTAVTDATSASTTDSTDAETAVTDATGASTTDSSDAETAVTDATDASTTDSTDASTTDSTDAETAVTDAEIAANLGPVELQQVFDDGCSITVYIPADAFAGFDYNKLSMQVFEVTPTDDLIALLNSEAANENKVVQDCRLFDVSIWYDVDGELQLVEPSSPVQVTFTGLNLTGGTDQAVYHIDDSATEATAMDAYVDEETGDLTADVPQFCIIAASSTTSTVTVTAEDIASGLSSVTDYAVVAKNYYLNNHVEGNIAVQNLQSISNKVGITSNVYSYLPSTFTLTVSISAGSSHANTAYKVGIYTDSSGKNSVTTVSLTTNAKGTASASVSLSSTKVYYAFLLDSSGSPILSSAATAQGITGGGLTLASSNDNYIQYVNGTSSELFQSATINGSIVPVSVTFGSDYTTASADNGNATSLKKGSSTIIDKICASGDANKVSSFSIASNSSFPYDFDTVFSNLSSLSQSLSYVSSTTDSSATLKVLQVTLNDKNNTLQAALLSALNTTDTNYLANTGISLASGQYLLINVDCGSNTSVTIPACRIGGLDYATAWTDTASRIIWNFYSSSSSDRSYSGSITNATGMLGNILAPSATFTVGSTMCGAVYAQTVKVSNGEIHKTPFRYGNLCKSVCFTLPGSNTTSLTVNKVWSDNNDSAKKRPTSITVTLYRNGSAYTTATLSSSNKWSYSFTDLPLKDSSGNEYTYTAKETAVDGYEAAYDTSVSGTVTITNTYQETGYTLPATGGIGVTVIYGTGISIVLISSGALLILIKRRGDFHSS
ncbi:MAG: hypothetical protein H6Q60_479 [Oscillospiraceae bacterium]|nr:hypothetical protein [Oscillospiraceae bacterium]